MPHLGVIGPRSRELVQKLTDADVSQLRYFRFIPDVVEVAGVPVYLSRTGYGGELGYELFLTDPADATELWNAVLGAGATPFGAEAIEILRIEAGLIVTDYDYEAHQRSPYDFNLDRFVALDKDVDFAGKERLREIAANPPNRLVTLKVEGDTLPEYGATVTKEGDEVGVLTSPTDSPRYGKIGIAIVRSGHAAPDAQLEVAAGGETAPATVDVSWAAPTDTGGGSVRYEVNLDSGGWTNSGTDRTHRFTGVGAGGHTVQVRAVNVGSGRNGPAASRNFTVQSPPPPQPSARICKGTTSGGGHAVVVRYQNFTSGGHTMYTSLDGDSSAFYRETFNIGGDGSQRLQNWLGIRNDAQIWVVIEGPTNISRTNIISGSQWNNLSPGQCS